ncbi:multidrug efflux SMR transporter [Helicobacter sp.]|uniref:DMT family transporter n=1 Tax=Helicobacter sp. TaxID=218 RepID=UPI0019B5D7B5|nr:multidrug efflux SMR transporter [Helicobacter sp.]MBD5165392.1 multidrug efflux SMR transporter [Helicobacter sp.]
MKISTNLAWGLIILGGIVECFWASGLKYADNLLLYTLTGIGILFSFAAMALAIKSDIEIGVAYSVFVGIGTVGIALAEICVFGEPFSLLKIVLILLLLIGVIGLKLATSEKENTKERDSVEEIVHELGLDDVVQEMQAFNQNHDSKKDSK